MIHAWIDLVLQVKESHGPNFHARMAAINAAQNQFQVSVRHQFPVPQTPPRWWAVCPRCGLRSPYQRRVHRAACRQCCNRHYGGSWHASCVFVYEPASPEALVDMFFWVLQVSGVSIALIGWQREQWLHRRRR